MDKLARVSTMMYKNKGTKLLKVLHIKCASVDSNAKLRAKMAFINCRISHEETAINILTFKYQEQGSIYSKQNHTINRKEN